VLSAVSGHWFPRIQEAAVELSVHPLRQTADGPNNLIVPKFARNNAPAVGHVDRPPVEHAHEHGEAFLELFGEHDLMGYTAGIKAGEA